MSKRSFVATFLIALGAVNFSIPYVEAGGCSSHKNKSAQIECFSNDDDCQKIKAKKNQKKVDI